MIVQPEPDELSEVPPCPTCGRAVMGYEVNYGGPNIADWGSFVEPCHHSASSGMIDAIKTALNAKSSRIRTELVATLIDLGVPPENVDAVIKAVRYP